MTFNTSLVTYDGQLLPVVGMTFDGVPITGPYVAPVSAADVAAAVLAALQASPLPVNLVQVRGQVIDGSGSETDPWGPSA